MEVWNRHIGYISQREDGGSILEHIGRYNLLYNLTDLNCCNNLN